MLGVAPKPVLKWAGGKWRVYEQIQHLVPRRYQRLLLPCVGGGAVFFKEWARTGFTAGAVLSDTNEEIINLYTVLRDDPLALIAELREMKLAHMQGQADFFYTVRDKWDLKALGAHERAARVLYLNKTCFNGLYRVNGSGKFNVPFGRNPNPLILDEANILAVHSALSDVSVRVADFEVGVQDAEPGDFVYFDPPYDPVSATSRFTAYSKEGFGRDSQERLAQTFLRLAKRGVHCLLSNSDTPFIRETYDALRAEIPTLVIEGIRVPRSINSNASKRGGVRELAVASGLPQGMGLSRNSLRTW